MSDARITLSISDVELAKRLFKQFEFKYGTNDSVKVWLDLPKVCPKCGSKCIYILSSDEDACDQCGATFSGVL